MIDFLWKNFFKKTEKNIKNVLKENPLFETLNNKELQLINNIIHRRSFIPGEFVFQKGKGLGMYIILSGNINILHSDSHYKKAIVISQLKPGDFFGEICLVQEQSYNYVSAQAAEETKLLGFFRPDLLTLNEKNSSISVSILMQLGKILGDRLHKASEKLSQIKSSNNQ